MTAAAEPIATGADLRKPRWRFRLWPILPLLAFLLALFLYPVWQLLAISFTDSKGAFSLAHYARLFASPVYVQVLIITFKVAAWTTLFCVVAGYPVAYLLATTRPNTRGMLILWVLLPFWTSFLVRTFAWIVLLGRNGAVNKWLTGLGIIDAPLSLIYNFTGVMIGMTHALMPLAILTMTSVMQQIPTNLVPAAGTLGARGGQAFWRIYFPLSLPGVAAAGLLVFITALGFFITPALLGGARETMITQVIIENIQSTLNWGFAGAVSMLLLTTSLVVFVLYDRMLGLSTLVGEFERGPTWPHWIPGRTPWLGRSGGAWLLMRSAGGTLGAPFPGPGGSPLATPLTLGPTRRRSGGDRLPGRAELLRGADLIQQIRFHGMATRGFFDTMVPKLFQLESLDFGDDPLLRGGSPDRGARDSPRHAGRLCARAANLPRQDCGHGIRAVAADLAADDHRGRPVLPLRPHWPRRHHVRPRARPYGPCGALCGDHRYGSFEKL